MERSRKRTPITKRSKGAGSTALVVTLGFAVFGVAGAAAGDGSYARHLRHDRLEARLAGAALAHRTPEELLLAMRPKAHRAPAAAPISTPAPAATSPAPAAPAPAPAATTPAATTPPAASTTSPSNTTPPSTTGATANLPAGTGSTPTDTGNGNGTPTDNGNANANTPGNADASANGNPNDNGNGNGNGNGKGNGDGNGNASGNGNGSTTTGTGTTTGPDANGNGQSSLPGSSVPGSTAPGSTTPPECHGRCAQGQTSGVVPGTVPSVSSSTGASNGFGLGVSPGSVPDSSAATPTAPAAPTTPVNAVSSGSGLNLPTSVATSTSSAPTTPSVSSIPALGAVLTHFPTAFTSGSAIRKLSHGVTRHPTHSTTVATAGTGGATAATISRGGTPPTTGARTLVASTSVAHAAPPAQPTHRASKPKHQSSGGSSLPAPFSAPATVITHIVNVIPSAVWIALAAAFSIALACAAVALRSSRRARRREREFVAISAAAQTDALTGILNRRGFTAAAEREHARASRYERPFVLAYVDVRGLKAVNDTEGHLTGDELIKAVAGLMKESARADDVVGRIGGDEFALLLAEQTAEGAEPVIRRIRARVEERRAEMEIRVPWELTIGIAAFPNDGSTLDELLGLADRRLYEQRGIALR